MGGKAGSESRVVEFFFPPHAINVLGLNLSSPGAHGEQSVHANLDLDSGAGGPTDAERPVMCAARSDLAVPPYESANGRKHESSDEGERAVIIAAAVEKTKWSHD